MANYNKVLLMGNLTRDPELKYTASGTAVANFGLAINRSWTGQDGNRREETTFVDCEVWSKQAETFCEYMAKGKPVFVEGRLRLDSWETQDWQKRSRLRVVCERFQFIGGRSGGGDEGGRGPGRPSPGQQERPTEDAEPPDPPSDDGDIPF